MGTQLYTGEDFYSLWQGIVKPWLKAHADTSWTSENPAVILVPSLSHAHFLKYKMARENLGFLGLRVWLPNDARAFLMKKYLPQFRIGERETFHWLLSAAAAQSADDSPLTRSMIEDPSSLWNEVERFDIPLENNLFKRFQEMKTQSHLLTPRETDARLLEQTKTTETFLNSALILNFQAQHWPLWNLLRAIAQSSRSSACALTLPRRAEWLQAAWMGSWEEICEPAQMVSFETPAPQRQIIFRAGENIRAQARAIVLQAVEFLKDDLFQKQQGRLGIVAPNSSALAREIAWLLKEAGIPHHDGIGHATPSLDDQNAWNAWLAWQEDGKAVSYLNFIENFHAFKKSFPVSLNVIREFFKTALAETLVDQSSVIQAHWQLSSSQEARRLAELLKDWNLLPEKASLEEWIALASGAFQKAQWNLRAAFLESLRQTHAHCLHIVCLKKTFLRWVRQLAESAQKNRYPQGAHFFSAVQLLSYEEAEHQEWTHLILAGLQEGLWPPVIESSGWINEEEIFQKNKSALACGSQGEGHVILKEGREIFLGPIERRSLLQQQFQNLIESTSHALCLTWSSADENENAVLPSEMLNQFFKETSQNALNDQKIQSLIRQTADWVASSHFPASHISPPANLEQTRIAYCARRNSASPFGIYDFSLEKPPARPVPIACKKFESLLRDPGAVWMEIFLGVKACSEWEPSDLWNITRGIWIHRWLNLSLNPQQTRAWISMPLPPDRLHHLHQAAEITRREIETVFQNACHPMPHAWNAVWQEARWRAQNLISFFTPYENWNYAQTERRLPPHFFIHIGKEKKLLLSGQIDLVLSKQKPVSDDAFPDEVWIVDYKTGNTSQKASLTNLHKGEGLQIRLYGLAARELGAKATLLTLLQTHQDTSVETDEETARLMQNFWEGLASLQERCVFGMRGEIDPEFGIKKYYPLSTLPIEADLSEERWQQTHPLLNKISKK
ncbi:MAG: PD-(D/E)XK nuclease family protein [Verrucomicrobiota bacterium]